MTLRKNIPSNDPRRQGLLALGMTMLLLAGVLLGTPARAQSATAESGWTFEFTPYLWLAGIKGTFGDGTTVPGGQPPSVDAGFDKLLNSLDFAFMGSIEARKGRWGVMSDLIYLSLSEDATVKFAPSLPSTGLKFNAELDGTIFTLGGAYRVSEGSAAVDVIGALRYYSLAPSINVTAGPAVRLVEPKANWTDPVVGIRIRHPLTSQWAVTGYADVGGFGIGSDLSYQLYGGAEYFFSKTFTGKIGYRHLQTDYEKDDRKLDLTFGGLMLGLGFRF
jgi:opacity protein-like surface antigen